MVLVAGIAGLVVTLVLLRAEPGKFRVVVADRDIEAGSVFRPGDVRVEAVTADREVLDRLVRARAVARMRGRIVTAPIAADEPVLLARLRPPAASRGRRAMSIPVERARAVNGRLVAGDRVDVVVADGDVAAIVVAGAEVLDVDADDGAFGARRRV